MELTSAFKDGLLSSRNIFMAASFSMNQNIGVIAIILALSSSAFGQKLDFEQEINKYAIERIFTYMSLEKGLQIQKQNACLIASDRKEQPQKRLCDLGRPTKDVVLKLLRVERFCRHPQLNAATLHTVHRNDKNLVEITMDLNLSDIANKNNLYPHAFYKFLGESPCLFSFHKSECYEAERQKLLRNSLEATDQHNKLVHTFRGLPSPKLKACEEKVMKKGMFDSLDLVSLTDAKDFCTWIKERAERYQNFSEAFYSRDKLEKLNKHIVQVGSAMLYGIQSSNLSDQTKREMIGRLNTIVASKQPYMDWINNVGGGNAQAMFNADGTRRIDYTPYHMALLDQPDGEKFLWLTTAHEMAHLITCDNYKLNSKFVHETVNGERIDKCIENTFGAYNHKQKILSENIADILTPVALASELNNTTFAEKSVFISKTFSVLCEIFEHRRMNSFSRKKTEIERSRIAADEPHTDIVDRIYMTFRNNKLRRQLGCDEISGNDYLCGFEF